MDNKGATIVAMAWPDAPIAMVGRWYDSLLHIIGIAKDGYCKIGHAAMLLIDHKDGEVYHMDFGRYHTPNKKGRARDKYTDPDLSVKIKAIIKDKRILNLEKILEEVYGNPSSHGEGRLIASEKYISSFSQPFQKVKNIQNKGALEHGPFTFGGSNCSRFVAQVSKTANLGFLSKFLLYVPYTISPSPVSNVRVINDYSYYYEYNNNQLIKKRNNLFFWKKKR